MADLNAERHATSASAGEADDLRGTIATSLRPDGLGLWLREPAR